LVDILTLYILDTGHVAWARRLGDEGLKLRQIDLIMIIVLASWICCDFTPIVRPSLRFKKIPYFVIRGKDACSRAEFSAHVGDHVPIHRGKALQSWAIIFDDLAHAAGHSMTAQHLEDDILSADPIGKSPHELDPQDPRHRGQKRLARHGERHIEPARANRQHAERACCRRMTIGAQQGFAG
jgi:hypothetical protein